MPIRSFSQCADDAIVRIELEIRKHDAVTDLGAGAARCIDEDAIENRAARRAQVFDAVLRI